jgi:glycosyltransferase involved in cell wall biosynthesis
MVRFRGPLLRALVERGHEVFAFAIDFDAESERRVRAFGAAPIRYKLDRVGMSPLRDLVSILQLRSAFRRLEIDLVFSYFIKPVIYATLAARSGRVRRRIALLPGLGYAFLERPGVSSLKQHIVRKVVPILLRSTLASNERIILYNVDDLQELARRKLVDPGRVTKVEGTGVDLSEYAFAEPTASPLTFLLAARLLGAKGIREYAAAARNIRQKFQQTRCVLLGGIENSPDGLAEQEVQSWVAEGILDWPGRVADVRPWLREASVYVLPSYREGSPRSVQEALAIGRPIITTDVAGCRDTVEDGVNGFLIPARNAKALEEAMESFVRRPELIEAMGSRSRRIAEDRYNVHKINERVLHSMGL